MTISTISYGVLPIRRTHMEGKRIDLIELAISGYAEIRIDTMTQQPFAVLLDDNFQEV